MWKLDNRYHILRIIEMWISWITERTSCGWQDAIDRFRLLPSTFAIKLKPQNKMTVELCKRTCLESFNCRSINYQKTDYQCQLNNFTKSDLERTDPEKAKIPHPSASRFIYYELNCSWPETPHSTIEIHGQYARLKRTSDYFELVTEDRGCIRKTNTLSGWHIFKHYACYW